mmetsp:Transcript_9238/g.18877  ORF Transcript_9238/g.18877 Transcript_9238/m.18877 type:complete len:361 (+) Transcript_9238:70-1152(+)
MLFSSISTLFLLLLFPTLAASCTCSPFSGNQGSCCPDNSSSCSHWGETLSCAGETPVCCNSNFASNCCPENSACSQGCRDSLLGDCFCIPPRESKYVEEDALYSLAFVAASQCEAGKGLNNTWSCTACPQSWPLSEVNVVNHNGHQVLVGFDGMAIVAAFRGSLSPQDWWADAENVAFTDYPECDGCKVGLGWYKAVQSVGDLVISAIADIDSRHPNSPIILTGHSLGAAMAPLFVVALEDYSASLASQITFPIYTFGQPRVGNPEYAAWANERFGEGAWFRVVHHNDPVPHLPPPALGYKHMATEVWYVEIGTGEANFMVCDGSGEDQECSSGTLVSGDFTDHNEYLDHDIHQCNPSGF